MERIFVACEKTGVARSNLGREGALVSSNEVQVGDANFIRYRAYRELNLLEPFEFVIRMNSLKPHDFMDSFV